MISTKQEKNKTTITIPRKLRKKELDRVIEYISFIEVTPKTNVSKKQIQELTDEISKSAWEKFKKARGIK